MLLQILKGSIINILPQRKPHISWNDAFKKTYYVLPNHISANFHMNNAKYLEIFEHSRWCQFIDMGLFKPLMKQKVNFVVASIEITYIKELFLFKKFTVETNNIAWSDKYIYIEQKIIVDHTVYTHAVFKVASLQNKKRLKITDLLDLLGIKPNFANQQDFIRKWDTLTEIKKNIT
jgi:acyl-CoA thioesterase FadM